MLNRREFLKQTAAAVAMAPFVLDNIAFPAETKLRDFGFISGIIGSGLKGDWKAVLRMAASFGYTEIETGGYLGESAESYLNFMNEIGIKPVAGGIDFTASDDELQKGFDMLNTLGMGISVVYWPWHTGGPFSLEDCRKSSERLNYLGRKSRENGLIFCWHNHDKEFIRMETGLPFDFLMENTDRELVCCELDLYWVKKGGGDPLSVMKKYKGRFPILHVKDMAPGPAMDFECPGSGIINFAELFREAEKQGIRHYMVERDNVPDGMACLRSAGEYLRSLKF